MYEKYVRILRSVFIDLRNSIRRSNANIFNTNITGVRYESDEASRRNGEILGRKRVQSSQCKQLTMTKLDFGNKTNQLRSDFRITVP